MKKTVHQPLRVGLLAVELQATVYTHERRYRSYSSDVGKTRAKTGRDIKLSWIESSMSHTSVRAREIVSWYC